MCYKEMRWLGILKQAGTREGNHRRHTQQTPAKETKCVLQRDAVVGNA